MSISERSLLALKLTAAQAADELRLAAAMKLYEIGRLSSGAAAELAGIPRCFFLAKLADYGIDTFRLTEDELKAIAAFYNSPAGKKLLEKGPQVTAEIGSAALIWQRGIARDLAEAVAKEMAAKHPVKAAPEPAAASGGDEPKQDDSSKQ